MKKLSKDKAEVFEASSLFYVKIPKCASTSIIQTLDAQVVEQEDGLSPSKRIFTVVRNPYSRLVSCWADRVAGQGWRNSFSKEASYWKSLGIARKMTFFEFAKAVAGIPDWVADVHFRSIVALLDDVPASLDFYIRLEELEKGWSLVVDACGEIESPPVIKKSAHKDWRRYYYSNPFLVDLIYERYQKDFETFGYGKLVA